MSIKVPKIFLDSGDPDETRKAKGLLGHLDGQTTNPSLVAKNPEIVKMVGDKKLTKETLLSLYKDIITEIEKEIAGPISVEVDANWDSTAKDLLTQAESMYTWGKNIYMKFPTTQAGIEAAHEFTKGGGRVNMTLVFTQNQAAAVYAATKEGGQQAFVSPFIGRWDDRGYNGLDLVKNILKLYRAYEKEDKKEGHVKVLAASIRTLDHLYSSIFMGADILTIPLKTVKEWIEDEKWVPDEKFRYDPEGLKGIVYEHIPQSSFETFKIERVKGDLLDEGLLKFAADWKNLIGR